MGRAGSDLALDTADAVIMRDDLATIPAVIALSRRARRVVTANLVIAAVIITALVAWDLAGHLPLPLGVARPRGLHRHRRPQRPAPAARRRLAQGPRRRRKKEPPRQDLNPRDGGQGRGRIATVYRGCRFFRQAQRNSRTDEAA